MKHRTATALLTIAVATAALTACGSDKDDSKPAAKPSASTPSSPQAPDASSKTPTAGAPKAKGIPPKPDAATQAKYLAALTAIDADIVNTKPDKAVDRGRNECETIANFPKDKAKQVDLANQRFTSPKHPDGFGPTKAAKIRDVVHKHLCPTY